MLLFIHATDAQLTSISFYLPAQIVLERCAQAQLSELRTQPDLSHDNVKVQQVEQSYDSMNQALTGVYTAARW